MCMHSAEREQQFEIENTSEIDDIFSIGICVYLTLVVQMNNNTQHMHIPFDATQRVMGTNAISSMYVRVCVN